MKSRTENAKLNILIGVFTQIFTIFLSFISRKIFLLYLPIDYLGINGLYTNILSVLSLAEMGLGSVVSYSLYKPVRENNREQICALVSYFKKLYRYIALAITGLGLLLVPFLKYIIRSDLSESDLIVYYLLFLLNSVATYFVAHNVSLLVAYQDNRAQKLVTLVSDVVTQLLHIAVLVLFANYMLYITVTVAGAFISNAILSYITGKKYPYIRAVRAGELSEAGIDKNTLLRKMRSGVLYKFSCVVLNSTDNILISVLVSTTAVGYYSNYLTVTTALQTFISILTTTVISAIGNLNTEDNKEKMLEIFNGLCLFYHGLSCFCALSMLLIFNRFIPLWIGEKYTMSVSTVAAIAFNFFITNMTTPIWSFREATGQFEKAKYIMSAAAGLNILLSVVLGIPFGIPGILLATSISKILTMLWYEPQILFKNVFGQSVSTYWRNQLRLTLCGVVSVLICMRLEKYLREGVLSIMLCGFMVALVCAGIYLLGNLKTQQLHTVLEIVKRCLKR